jgi:hypothetical protein
MVSRPFVRGEEIFLIQYLKMMKKIGISGVLVPAPKLEIGVTGQGWLEIG